MNVFGSLAIATTLALGGIMAGPCLGDAWATDYGNLVITGESSSLALSSGDSTATSVTIGGTSSSDSGILTVGGDSKLTVSGATEVSTDGSLTVSGGTYNVGSSDAEWVTDAVSGAELDASGLAILAIYEANKLSISSGSLSVGSLSTSSDMNFGSSSLLVVNASNFSDGTNYALSASTIDVETDASQLVSNVSFTDGTATVNIASGTTSLAISEDGAWGYGGTDTESNNTVIDTDTIHFDNSLVELDSISYENNTYTVTLNQLSAADTYTDTAMDPTIAAFIDKNNASGTLSDYLNEAISNNDIVGIESVTKTAVAAGVINTGAAISGLASSTATGRVSFTGGPLPTGPTGVGQNSVLLADNGSTFTDGPSSMIADTASANGLTNGLAIWLQPMFQSVKADGFKSGNYSYGYDTDIFGVSLGADYTVQNSIRYGLALHMGGGSSESNNSDLAYTENDFDYFGATLYAGYVMDRLSLSADMGYTVATNDLDMKTASDSIYARDFDSTVFSLGLRAEYKFAANDVDVIPYLGARLNYFETESFDLKDSSGSFAHHNLASHATTFAIPMGVTFATSFHADSIEITPRLSLGAQFTMGDLDVEQKLSGSGSMESEVFDPITFMGGLGMDVKFDDVTLALDYNLGASENVTSHQLMATLRYAF